MNTTGQAIPFRGTLFAIALGYAGAAAWVLYAHFVFANQVPMDAIEFHGLYPLSLGASAFAAAILFHRNIKSLGLTNPGWRFPLYAIAMAAVIVLLPFFINLLTSMTAWNSDPPFDMELVAAGIPVTLILALGEEVMWRGVLHSFLAERFGFVRTALITGMLWALWHYPVIIHTKFIYADRPLSFVLPMFTANLVALSFVFTWLRTISGSVWPCVVLHGFINYFFIACVVPLESDSFAYSAFFKSDIGVTYVCLSCALASVVIQRYNSRKT